MESKVVGSTYLGLFYALCIKANDKTERAQYMGTACGNETGQMTLLKNNYLCGLFPLSSTDTLYFTV